MEILLLIQMVKNIYTCDRCKKEVEHKETGATLYRMGHVPHIHNIEARAGVGNSCVLQFEKQIKFDEHEYCKECFDRFQKLEEYTNMMLAQLNDMED